VELGLPQYVNVGWAISLGSVGQEFFFGEDEHVRGYNERKKKGKISSVTFRLLTKHTE